MTSRQVGSGPAQGTDNRGHRSAAGDDDLPGSPEGVYDSAEDAADSRWRRWTSRWGLAARGLVYALVGWLALQVALGAGTGAHGTDKQASSQGAIAAVAQTGGGGILLMLLLTGLVGYAVFQLVDGLFGHEEEDSPWPRWGNRALSLWGVVVYTVFCWQVLRLVVAAGPDGGGSGSTGSTGSSPTADTWTARALGLPAGKALVVAVGVGIAVAGFGLLRRAVLRTYLDRLHLDRMPGWARTGATVLGSAGCLARSVVFLAVAAFLVRAGAFDDPSKASGLDETLRRVAQAAYGPWLIGAVATGLLLYGGYCLLEARWRRV